MCSHQVWVKRGCPVSLVQSASSQELLLQTLYHPYVSYSHCHIWMACLVPMMRLEISGGALAWHRPPSEGENVCSQFFTHFLTHLPFLELGIIAPIACSHQVFALRFSKMVFKVLTKFRISGRLTAGCPALIRGSCRASPSQVLTERGLLRGEEGHRPIGIDRQTDRHTSPPNPKTHSLFFLVFQPAGKCRSRCQIKPADVEKSNFPEVKLEDEWCHLALSVRFGDKGAQIPALYSGRTLDVTLGDTGEVAHSVI